MHVGKKTGKKGIESLMHPSYAIQEASWEKWRLTYVGGTRFLRKYLRKFSSREDDTAFEERRLVSYVPAFAKAAVDEVKNSIFQRLADIIREDGPKSYQAAIEGYKGGVDKRGSSMTTFMGRDVLPELLTMARVGVFVDMPPLAETTTLAEKGEFDRPYLYWYKAEDIRSWRMRDDGTENPTEFKALLLRDSLYGADSRWKELTSEVETRYRYIWIDDEDGLVHVQYYRMAGIEGNAGFAGAPGANGFNSESGEWMPDDGEVVLNITKIPFVLLEISDSLLSDVADYQISLVNLASSDMNYALRSNYPFYVEQYDWKADAPYMKPAVPGVTATTQTIWDPATLTTLVTQEKVKEVKVGSSTGRRYPIGTERPGFIHPSSEPLAISMQKQEQLKTEIRQLVHLAISTLSSTRQSAESMGLDNQGLEAGLSYVGLELQHAERKIAEYWAMYEGGEAAAINYPTQYSILSDSDRRAAAAELQALLPMVPSLTFRREVAKRIVDVVLGSKVKGDVLRAIKDEIDKDPVVLGDPAVIETDVVNGLVDLETASAARGYPKGVVEKAKGDHAERLARIATSQASAAGMTAAATNDPGARGVPDLSANPQAGAEEKTASQVDQTNRDQVKPRVRGEGA